MLEGISKNDRGSFDQGDIENQCMFLLHCSIFIDNRIDNILLDLSALTCFDFPFSLCRL